LVEQRTENPCVAGSIPADTTKKASYVIIRGFFIIRVSLSVSVARVFYHGCRKTQQYFWSTCNDSTR